MKAHQKLFSGLILSLLVFTGSVRSQGDPESCSDNESGVPNPVVNVTLTAFSQNPQFINDIVSDSYQIGELAAHDFSTGDVLSLPLITSLISNLSLNLMQTVEDINNLLIQFGSIIGQESTMQTAQAAISNFTSTINETLAVLQNVDLNILPTQNLTNILFGQLEQNYQNFANIPAFAQYAYYTAQPLFINALVHMATLNSYLIVCYYDSSCQSYPLTIQELYTSYLSLLQQYASTAVSYRMYFMNLDSEYLYMSDICGDESCMPWPEDLYKFDDSFTGYQVSLEALEGEDNPQIGRCYEQAIQDGTSAFFDGLATSFSNSLEIQSQSVASLLFE